MKKIFRLRTLAVATLALCGGSVLAFAAEEPFTTPMDVPVLGPKGAERSLVPPAEESIYSLFSLKYGAVAGGEYNSNIFKAASGEESDYIFTFAPEVSLTTNLTRHEFGVYAEGEIGRFAADEKNNYLDRVIGADARFDVTPTDVLYFDARHTAAHVGIGSFVDDVFSNTTEPVEYDLYTGEADWKGHKDLYHYSLTGIWNSYSYENVGRVDGTRSIQEDRDRDTHDIIAKTGYEFIPSYLFYVRGALDNRDYDKRIDSSADFSRDSDGYRLAVGVSNENKADAINFDAYVGYMNQDYDAQVLDDVSGIDAYAAGSWKITPANTLSAKLDREIRDSQSDGVSGILNTRFGMDFQHQYSEALALKVGASYTDSNFETNTALTDLDRQDDIYDAYTRGSYTLNPNTSVNVEYSYRDRESNRPFASYEAHSVGLSLALKY